jgi:hypothetical protein
LNAPKEKKKPHSTTANQRYCTPFLGTSVLVTIGAIFNLLIKRRGAQHEGSDERAKHTWTEAAKRRL